MCFKVLLFYICCLWKKQSKTLTYTHTHTHKWLIPLLSPYLCILICHQHHLHQLTKSPSWYHSKNDFGNFIQKDFKAGLGPPAQAQAQAWAWGPGPGPQALGPSPGPRASPKNFLGPGYHSKRFSRKFSRIPDQKVSSLKIPEPCRKGSWHDVAIKNWEPDFRISGKIWVR